MNVTRMKLVGVFLGLVAFGAVLGAAFSGYGGFASAATQGYAGSQSAVTTDGKSEGTTEPANTRVGGKEEVVNKEDILHYADLFEQNLASQLGITTDKLESSVRAAFTGTVDQAVTDGKLNQSMADAIKSKIDSMTFKDLVSMPLNMVGKQAGEDNIGDNQAFIGATLKAFDAGAQLLGITRDEFEKALRDDSIPALLTARNVTAETLTSTMGNVLRTELNKAVASGTLTQAQADEMYNGFTGKIGYVLSGPPSTK